MQQGAQPIQQQMAPAQAPMATTAPSAAQDALRPPGAVGPAPATAAAPQQGGAPMVTASLPVEDQPETGTPQELPANLKRQLVEYQTKEPAGTIVWPTFSR